jgi:hypothetical protein
LLEDIFLSKLRELKQRAAPTGTWRFYFLGHNIEYD